MQSQLFLHFSAQDDETEGESVLTFTLRPPMSADRKHCSRLRDRKGKILTTVFRLGEVRVWSPCYKPKDMNKTPREQDKHLLKAPSRQPHIPVFRNTAVMNKIPPYSKYNALFGVRGGTDKAYFLFNCIHSDPPHGTGNVCVFRPVNK